MLVTLSTDLTLQIGLGQIRLHYTIQMKVNYVYRHNLYICRWSDHWVTMERCTQKGVAWECPQGSGVRVNRSKVRASWTAHKRR